MSRRKVASPKPQVSRESAASLVGWAMQAKLDVMPSGRAGLVPLGVTPQVVTESLAWADHGPPLHSRPVGSPKGEQEPRRRRSYLRRVHVNAVDALYRVDVLAVERPYRWVNAELLGAARGSLLDLYTTLSFRPGVVTWGFEMWDQLNLKKAGSREAVIIRASLLADELDRAALLGGSAYSRSLLQRRPEHISDLVDKLLVTAVGPPASARAAIRLLARLCCHSDEAWKAIQRHIRESPLGHRDHAVFSRMLSSPTTPPARATDIANWLIEPPGPDEHEPGNAQPRRGHRVWNVQELITESLGLLPTSLPVEELPPHPRGPWPRVGISRGYDLSSCLLPNGLWPPDSLREAEEKLRERTRKVIESMRGEQGRHGLRVEDREDPVARRLREHVLNDQFSWRARAVAADALRTHRPGSYTIRYKDIDDDALEEIARHATARARTSSTPDRAVQGLLNRQALSRRYVERTFDEVEVGIPGVLDLFDKNIKEGLDPSGGLKHALTIFRGMETKERHRTGRPSSLRLEPSEPPDEAHDNQLLRTSDAIGSVLESILDAVIPTAGESDHTRAFTDAISDLAEGIDPVGLHLDGQHQVPPSARRGVRALIRNTLGSVDITRERRAIESLVAGGMSIPCMAVFNRLLQADLKGEIPDDATFLVELALLYLGHLGENPLAGLVVLRWLDTRWPQWRPEIRSMPRREPASSPTRSGSQAFWPEDPADRRAHALKLHHLELLHTAIWALGDIRWDAEVDPHTRLALQNRWNRVAVLLYDVATYGSTEPELRPLPEKGTRIIWREHLVNGAGELSSLSVLREAASYALATCRWGNTEVTGAERTRYSHDLNGSPSPGAYPLDKVRNGDDRSPRTAKEIAEAATDVLDRMHSPGTTELEVPKVLRGLCDWRGAYRDLVYRDDNVLPSRAVWTPSVLG